MHAEIYCHADIRIDKQMKKFLFIFFGVCLLFVLFIYFIKWEESKILLIFNYFEIQEDADSFCQKITSGVIHIPAPARMSYADCLAGIKKNGSITIYGYSAIFTTTVMVFYFSNNYLVGKAIRNVDNWSIPCNAPADEGEVKSPSNAISRRCFATSLF